MGRITMFFSDQCPHSQRCTTEFDAHGIPFTAISVTQHPEKRADMVALSDRLSTPQVFFNTRHVGGAEDTIKLLKQWATDKSRYSSALERYQQEIAQFPDPTNPRFSVPTSKPTRSFVSALPKAVPCVSLGQNNEMRTVIEVTEMLKGSLPVQGLSTGSKMSHVKGFTGKEAVTALQKLFDLSAEESQQVLLEELVVKHNIIQQLSEHKSGTARSEFCLQCHRTPQILNSYSIWKSPVTSEPNRFITDLKELMTEIELACSDENGIVDWIKVKTHEKFAKFEEAACVLQGVGLESMDDSTKLAFGLNTYNLMIKYAFAKVGIGATDYKRFLFYNRVKFQVGGHVFSFQDWESGMMRGNRKAPFVLGLQFPKKDTRLALVVKKPDPRIHFGLNCGAKSCPPIRIYTPGNLDEELKVVAQSFCEDDNSIRLDPAKNAIYVSQIFQWYRVDFADSKTDLPRALLPYLRGTKHQSLHRMITSAKKKIQVHFNTYDWGTNASNYEVFEPERLVVESNKSLVSRLLQSNHGSPTKHSPTKRTSSPGKRIGSLTKGSRFLT